jgi:phosphoribosylanthranilate isomerase
MKGALPGGNAISFDWSLIAGRSWVLPWLLSGGLNAGNLAAAIAATGAASVDVSSGVEDSPGKKSPEKIAAFLRLAATL